jgi:hypothetical protein
MLVAIIERQARAHMLAGADVVCCGNICRPTGVMRFEKQSSIADPLRHPEQLVGKFAPERWAAVRPVGEP